MPFSARSQSRTLPGGPFLFAAWAPLAASGFFSDSGRSETALRRALSSGAAAPAPVSPLRRFFSTARTSVRPLTTAPEFLFIYYSLKRKGKFVEFTH